MAKSAATTEGAPAKHDSGGPMAVEKQMFVWTWITFGLTVAVLAKFAWKPILAILDEREKKIAKSVDDAEEIDRQLTEIQSTRDAKIAEADDEAKEIVAASRKAANEAARVIENKAKEESQIMLENADREINAARDKAESKLRTESAELAVALAGKILGEELSEKKHRKLTDKLIAEL
ncbi:MAG: F0F1 ATP synthase subunit B [Verrucomicrobiota bacterium]